METVLPGLASAKNVHPLFVHFPVVLFVLLPLLFGVAWRRRDDALWKFGRWVLTLGVASAIVAIVTGFIAADGLGHESPNHDRVHLHRNLMLATSTLAVVTAGAAHLWRERADRRPVVLILAVVVALAVILGADRGAELVYRYGMGVNVNAERHHGGDHAH